ncbi:MAG: hypothetical protein ACLPIX_04145, partial [Rhodomicrobium sp.]
PTHAGRNAFIHAFVHNYNRTRLRCLGYLAPLQALANQTGHNTKASLLGEGGVRGLAPVPQE